MSGKISPVFIISLGQEGFWGSLRQCPAPRVRGEARAEHPPTRAVGYLVAAHPIPTEGARSCPGAPACPNLRTCTDRRKGQGLNVPPRRTEFADSGSPRGSALCHRPLYRRGGKRRGLLSGWRAAALPSHRCHQAAKPRRSWVAAHFAQPFAVMINPGWSHRPSSFLRSALTWEQATVSQVCRSVHAERAASQHTDRLDDGIPACR